MCVARKLGIDNVFWQAAFSIIESIGQATWEQASRNNIISKKIKQKLMIGVKICDVLKIMKV